MSDEHWFPLEEIRLIFRHLVTVIAIALAIWLATRIFSRLAPEWEGLADQIEGFMFMGLLAILGIKLVWDVIRINGGSNVFVTA